MIVKIGHILIHGMEWNLRVECFRVTNWNRAPSHTTMEDNDHSVTIGIDKHHRYYHGKSIIINHVLFLRSGMHIHY